MSALEGLKAFGGRLAGIGRPRSVKIRPRKAHAMLFKDDGETPNNARLPFVIYRSPISLAGADDAAALFEALFAKNHWAPEWRNGIYNYNHFHTGVHEVLGIARGSAKMRFGGTNGRTLEVRAGDVVIHPAGVGHCRIRASKNLLVVGAYPAGGRYDEPQPFEVDHIKALESIAQVPIPTHDPVYGRNGPLRTLWR